MKKIKFLALFLLLSLGIKAQAVQTFSVNIYGGYSFSDKIEYEYSRAYVEDAFQYGVGLEYFLRNHNSIEIKYLREDTRLPLYGGPLGMQLNAGDDKGALNFILVEGTHYFDRPSSKVAPFIGGGLGLGILETPQSGNDTNFAWDIKAGVKIKTNSAVSVNLHAYLQSMTAAVGDSYYWTYFGIVGVTDYVSTFQFGLGGVISFNIK
ncbi:outer membrane beta-barrel protein [Flavobacterium agrisoli]|uniref:Outer membrane beta-barrel protein n=1 Tax=Flavobacterium agrisoli TaxID=2793066 RepID=A0A934PQ10_9FLAO|nr:outer membrane beta-barrel protein [Flavobacterium agrisoli]MBK0370804.1 outer membrane beta-barrel protein [Flavobacterium agrisoli]